MCQLTHNRPDQRPDESFDPSVKCCTYNPDLHNFTVGAIIADREPDGEFGRVVIRDRIQSEISVTPVGINPTPSYRAVYDGAASRVFGRAPALRCPYYLTTIPGGGCGVWRHRNAVCATWFCKHVRGDIGGRFWTDAKALLNRVETELSLWCCKELGIAADALRQLLAPPSAAMALERELVAHVRQTYERELWGKWRERKVEFFVQCASIVDSLTWRDVVRVGGETVAVREQILRESYDRLIRVNLPSYLKARAVTVQGGSNSMVRISTYSANDPLQLRREIVDALVFFDGRSTHEALEAIDAEMGIVLEVALVQRLVDYGILHSVTSASTSTPLAAYPEAGRLGA